MNNFFVHESSYVDINVKIGKETIISHFCHIQEGAVIGNNCTLGQNVNISNNVKIGNRVTVQNNVSIYEGVHLQNDVFCGTSMVFTNDLTPRAKYPKGRSRYLKTYINQGVIIGANATVLCGLTIGKFAVIAVRAVVTKDVPAFAVMEGIPAKQIGWVCQCGQILCSTVYCNLCKKELNQWNFED